MKKIYNKPECVAVEMQVEAMMAASREIVIDNSVQVDQLSNERDMWGNETIWD